MNIKALVIFCLYSLSWSLNSLSGLKESYRQGDSLSFTIDIGITPLDSLELVLSDYSGGPSIRLDNWSINEQALTVSTRELVPGHQYLTLKNSQNDADSIQWEFLLKSDQLFELESPGSGATVSEIPVLKWNGPMGVKQWKWYLSDQPFNFNEDSSRFEGVILQEGFVSRPELDLTKSSLSQEAKSPLVTGQRYFFALFPSYGNQLNEIDFDRALLNSFVYMKETENEQIQIIYPSSNDTIKADQPIIEFIRWNRVEKAQYYVIRILKSETRGNFQFDKSVVEFFSSDTTLPINFNELSLAGSVQIQISAYSDNSFLARTNSQPFISQLLHKLKIPTIPHQAQVLAVSSHSKKPLYFEIGADETIELTPGDWELTLQVRGFQTTEISLNINSDTIISPSFTALDALLQGRLIDHQGLAISGGKLQLLSLNTGNSFMIESSNQGYINTYLDPGSYEYQIINLSNVPTEPQTILMSAGDTNNLGDLIVRQGTSYWQGIFKNEQNQFSSSVQFDLYTSNGQFLYKTQTNIAGRVELELIPGVYQLRSNHPNIADQSIEILIPQERIEQYQLLPSAFRISGHLEIQSQISTDSVLASRMPDYPIYAFTSNSDTIKLYTDLQGEFSLQVGNPDPWTIGFQWKDRLYEIDNYTLETPDKNLIIQSGARLKGKILETGERNQFSVHARSNGEVYPGKILKENEQLFYLIEDLPEGDYQIEVQGLNQLGQSSVPTNIFKNILLNRFTEFTGPDIALNNSSRLTIFQMIYQGIEKSAQVNLRTPLSKQISTGDSLNLSQGLYQYSMIPNDLNIIPLSLTNFNREDITSDSISIDFQDSHVAKKRVELIGNTYDSTYTITFNYLNIPDSIHLNYRWGQSSYKSLQADTISGSFARFNIPIEGIGIRELDYHIEVYRNELKFSNREVGKPFRTQFVIAPKDWILFPLMKDTLKSPTKSLLHIPLKVINRQGQTQDLAGLSSTNYKLTNSNNNFDFYLDSSTQTLYIKTPETMDTTTLYLNLIYRGDTLTWEKHCIASEIMADNIEIKKTPSQRLYQAGDTITLSSRITSKNSLETYDLLSDFEVSHGQISESKIIIPERFIGPIFISTSWNQLRTEEIIEVSSAISPKNNQTTLIRDSNFVMYFPANSNLSLNPIPIRLRSDLKDSITWGAEEVNILEGAYSLYYPNLVPLDTAPYLQYTLPDSVEKIDFRLFNDSAFEFINLEDNQITYDRIYDSQALAKKKISTSNPSFVWNMTSTYPVFFDISNDMVTKEEPYLIITPNPFSPEIIAVNDGNTEAGARIDFLPKAPLGQNALVSILIYNMAGEKVRTLVNRKVFAQEEQNIYWDGLTDSGRLSRNGRYIVHFLSGAINKKSSETRLLKTVVVFK